jgi:hypothetical protein
MLALLALPLLLALAQPPPGGQPEPAASAEPAPQSETSPTPAPMPTAATTPTPAPTPNLFPYVVQFNAPPGGGPRILQIALNDRVQHLGKTLMVKVSVSNDVTGVTVASMGESYQLPPAGPGAFGMMYTLPTGFFASMYAGRDYSIDVVATAADGKTTKATISMRLER